MRSLAILLALAGTAAAEEHLLRIGTIAPEGTGWAHEFRGMSDDISMHSKGGVRIKWYMGGIAGDELEMLDRVRRGQLDGILSAGVACETTAPSLLVARIPGMFQTWAETSYVLGRLRPQFAVEAQKNGFLFLAEAVVGPSIVFSRRPVATLADLRSTRLWVWDLDKTLSTFLPAMGIKAVPLPIRDAARAYEDGRIDGFISPAAAALGFQWSAASRHYTDLRMGFVVGCLLIANRAFDAMPLDLQQAIRVGAARAKIKLEEVGRAQDTQLVNGLFAKQGLKKVPADDGARVTFLEAARTVRERSWTLVSPALVTRVLGMLADYRSEHH
ncbi:MAG: hypothetical protein JWN44_5165 [Myxococcales bacterium]|nr:hypothetical protein [Myxococcales bacterium]